ncbi:MAG TPA: tRNA adenosine deaminase-associated protein [Mycobacteriales bacterium]|nr:tRNA adenosine deaminase-associated protein [Mycobacteriales bacterium]
MPHSALALARSGPDWTGADIDLDELEDLDAVVDALRDRFDSGTVVLLVEEDDEWCGIVRLEGDDDVRVFVSDGRVVEIPGLAQRFFEDALPPIAPLSLDDDDEAAGDDDDDDDTGLPDIEPVGDSDLLSDLGTNSAQLLGLCAEEGVLPSDLIAAVVEAAGAGDVLEKLRPA